MIKLSQPCNYLYHGAEVWINPDEVVSICRSEHEYNACIITLKDRRSFTIDGSADIIAEKLSKAKEGGINDQR